MRAKVCILTISDRCSQGQAEDASGRTLKELIGSDDRLSLCRYAIVPDDADRIRRTLCEWADEEKSDVILTTGGTGFSVRDVTPEATKDVIEREAPGIAIALISGSLKETPFAMLSRLTAGIRRNTLIVNLPGSPTACRQCFAILHPVLQHCVTQLRGDLVNNSIQHEQMTPTPSQIVISMKSKADPPPPALRDRVSPFQMLDVNDAMDTIVREAETMSSSTELVPLHQLRHLIGRTLAVDLVSNVNIPPFQASVKDGYAVQTVDGAGSRKVMSVPSTAGTQPNKLALTSGYCVRIATGAPIPHGADAVVQVEDTKLLAATETGEELEIQIMTKPSFGQDIRTVGADVKRGDTILKEGAVLGPVELGLVSSVGFKEVPVVRSPTVAILSTGDEIVAAGQQSSPGKIWDSNKTTLSALLCQKGIDYLDLGIAKDDYDSLYNKLVEAFDQDVDVLITTGGVSMGEKDVLKRILEVGFEAKNHFARLNMKPGKPMAFMSCDWKGSKKLVFGLPGNPVSAFVTCFLFVVPAIQVMSGKKTSRKGLKAYHRILKAVFKSSKPLNLDSRPEFARGILTFENDLPEVELISGSQVSSRLVSIRDANVLLWLPQKSSSKSQVFAGETVTAILLT